MKHGSPGSRKQTLRAWPRPRRVCWLHWPGRTLRHRDRQPIRVAGMQQF